MTDSVIDEVHAWQSRPLESTYAVVFFDALPVKIRDEGLVQSKSVYLTIGQGAGELPTAIDSAKGTCRGG